MSNDKIYDKLIYQYEQNQPANQTVQEQRKSEIYQALPEVKNLEDEIRHCSTAMFKDRLSRVVSPEETAAAQAHILSLATAQQNLLKDAGYPADYLDKVYTCPSCHDTCFIGQEPCTCLKKAYIAQHYTESGMADILTYENFQSFSLTYYSKEEDASHQCSPYVNMQHILQQVQKYLQHFKEEKKGILLYGDTGLGKSFLSHCIAKNVLDQGFTVRYLTAVDLFENIISEAVMNRNPSPAVKKTYEEIYKADLLIIDDLGTEFTNSFTNTHLFQIVNQRSRSKKATLISTNLNLKEIKQRYTERILSRIIEEYDIFEFYGSNIRYQKRSAKMKASKSTVE